MGFDPHRHRFRPRLGLQQRDGVCEAPLDIDVFGNCLSIHEREPLHRGNQIMNTRCGRADLARRVASGNGARNPLDRRQRYGRSHIATTELATPILALCGRRRQRPSMTEELRPESESARLHPPESGAAVAHARRAMRIGRAVAITADALQLALFPIFMEGFSSVLNDMLDVVVCFIMVRLVGWNVLFAPTFVAELLPLGDLAPTWTVAFFIATRSRRAALRAKSLDSGDVT